MAGSSLCLDQAVRNLVAWGVASAAEALVMAGDGPRAALAPALRAHGLAVDAAVVDWSDAGFPRAVTAGWASRAYEFG